MDLRAGPSCTGTAVPRPDFAVPYNMGMENVDSFVVGAVVTARFIVPLLIPRYPLPALLASLLLDAADREIFELLATVRLEDYQSYDKALDIFYLTVAMLAALRNWASFTALRIARFLLYYRLVGVALFELTGARPLLLLFPNTFEYFFIAYEVVATRWSPGRLTRRHLILLAAGIWVLIKLPQEYWIHVLRLDVTEQLAALPPELVWWSVAFTMIVLPLAGVTISRRIPAPDHRLSLRGPALPPGMESASQRARFVAQRWRTVDLRWVEKTWLCSLMTVIFAQIIPGVDATPVQLGAGVAVVVGYNSLLRLRVVRSGRSIDSAVVTFVLLLATNAVWVYAAGLLLHRRGGGLEVLHSLFFLSLLSLVVTMYDRWRPVCELRHEAEHHRGKRPSTAWGA